MERGELPGLRSGNVLVQGKEKAGNIPRPRTILLWKMPTQPFEQQGKKQTAMKVMHRPPGPASMPRSPCPSRLPARAISLCMVIGGAASNRFLPSSQSNASNPPPSLCLCFCLLTLPMVNRHPAMSLPNETCCDWYHSPSPSANVCFCLCSVLGDTVLVQHTHTCWVARPLYFCC